MFIYLLEVRMISLNRFYLSIKLTKEIDFHLKRAFYFLYSFRGGSCFGCFIRSSFNLFF